MWKGGDGGDNYCVNCWRRQFLYAQSLQYYFIKSIRKNIFSPVIHCIPDGLPYVIVCCIFYETQSKYIVEMRCKEGKQHCQSLRNRECENTPYVSPEFSVWILQWVAIDTEGTGSYDVSGVSIHRPLHVYSGTWKQSIVVLLDKIFIY